MEGLVVLNLFGDVYRGKRVLLTGHTGFKGSWLALWLKQLGANVAGVALDPDSSPNHWQLCGTQIEDVRLDICQGEEVRKIVSQFNPEVVFHLAAQPLVRRSYAEPVNTWATNVMGTVELLETCRHVSGLKAIVVVTSDKCYENRSQHGGYQEGDPLGGFDPYSASKAATELVASSYRNSFFSQPGSPLLATARAGNVIGGGDWGEDRLIPDMYRAMVSGRKLDIRSPNATRPWQHVLDALAAYLLLGKVLLEGHQNAASAWNFGPELEQSARVIDLLQAMKSSWPELQWQVDAGPQPHEAALLHLDCSKATKELLWRPVWNLERTIEMTADWYRAFQNSHEARSLKQLNDFVSDARAKGAVWV